MDVLFLSPPPNRTSHPLTHPHIGLQGFMHTQEVNKRKKVKGKKRGVVH